MKNDEAKPATDDILSPFALKVMREIDARLRAVGADVSPLDGFGAMAHRTLLLAHEAALRVQLADAQEIIADLADSFCDDAFPVGHQWCDDLGDPLFAGDGDERGEIEGRANVHVLAHRARVGEGEK